MKSNGRFVARVSILSFLLSLEDELTHYASCVEKNRLAALCGGRIKLDLDSILQGYGFLTMLPSGDLLNFGNSGNNN